MVTGRFRCQLYDSTERQTGIHSSELLWLDERTGHLIGRERPRLVAELLCRLAQGASPADLAKTLPRELLRDEEGFTPRDPDV